MANKPTINNKLRIQIADLKAALKVEEEAHEITSGALTSEVRGRQKLQEEISELNARNRELQDDAKNARNHLANERDANHHTKVEYEKLQGWQARVRETEGDWTPPTRESGGRSWCNHEWGGQGVTVSCHKCGHVLALKPEQFG